MARRSQKSNAPQPVRNATPVIVLLADRIHTDIQRRKLTPGDPYLNAAETAKMLKVGTATANRALQLLEHRHVLVRRQRSGTFIAEPPLPSESQLARINLIVDQNFLKTEGLLADGVLLGIQSVLPRAELRSRFMPVTDDPEFVHEMIDEALQSPEREGFVLVRSSLTVQKLVADSGLPAVIHGTPYPSIKTIPSIDRDIIHSGQLLMDYLLKKDCQNILLLLRQQVLPGDHDLLDTIQECLEGQGKCSFSLRCLPGILEEVETEVLQLLNEKPGKWGMICRSEPLAEGAASALRKFKTKLKREQGEIVVADVYRSRQTDVPPWIHTQLMLSPHEIGARIGEILAASTPSSTRFVDHCVIPVRLVDADGKVLSE